jgi:hypothetical protein
MAVVAATMSSDYRGGREGWRGTRWWEAVRWCGEEAGGWWAGSEGVEPSRGYTREEETEEGEGARGEEGASERKKPRKACGGGSCHRPITRRVT